MDARIPGRVLIVRLGAIGDVTNALVLASALRRAAPATAIGWAVHDQARPLVDGHPDVARVHHWPRGAGLAGFRRLVAELRRECYELAIDLQRIQKSALVARLSGAPRVLGFDRARTKEASWIWTTERIAAGSGGAHMIGWYLAFARGLGIEDARVERRLPADPEAERWADERVAELGAPPIALNVGATKPGNRWEPARFGELAARAAAELEAPVCLTGGPEDRAAAERALERAAALGGAPRDLVGRTTLRQLVALYARSRAFVGCDTGPMHLAAAVELPVVALFGPADPARTGPWGDGHVVLRAPPRDGRERTDDVGVDEVLAALRERVAAPAP